MSPTPIQWCQGAWRFWEDDVSSSIETSGGEGFYLQIVDNTGHTLDLVANGASNVLR